MLEPWQLGVNRPLCSISIVQEVFKSASTFFTIGWPFNIGFQTIPGRLTLLATASEADVAAS